MTFMLVDVPADSSSSLLPLPAATGAFTFVALASGPNELFPIIIAEDGIVEFLILDAGKDLNCIDLLVTAEMLIGFSSMHSCLLL